VPGGWRLAVDGGERPAANAVTPRGIEATVTFVSKSEEHRVDFSTHTILFNIVHVACSVDVEMYSVAGCRVSRVSLQNKNV